MKRLADAQFRGWQHWPRRKPLLVRGARQVIPVEVKGGAAGRLRRLHMLLADKAQIPYGLILSTARYAELPDQRLRFVPIYHALGATLGANPAWPFVDP